MITKNDLILLMTEMGEDTVNIQRVISSPSIPLDILKDLHDKKSLDVVNFYDKIRKSYNAKKSKLYINLMRSDEQAIDDPNSLITTLTALLNQIMQYKVDNKPMFYKHMRCEEILDVLKVYYTTYNFEPIRRLLSLIKADIYVLETINGHREL